MPDDDATKKLGKYRNRPIRGVSISVTNAGDGLSKAMKVEPRDIKPDEDIYVVLRTRLAKDDYVYAGDGCTLVYVLRAGDATIVDADLVKAIVDEQADRIQEAEDREKGLIRLPDGSALSKRQAEGLRGEHILGEHAAGLVPGCSFCEDELASQQKEAAAAK